jgi:hypothetical protein
MYTKTQGKYDQFETMKMDVMNVFIQLENEYRSHKHSEEDERNIKIMADLAHRLYVRLDLLVTEQK